MIISMPKITFGRDLSMPIKSVNFPPFCPPVSLRQQFSNVPDLRQLLRDFLARVTVPTYITFSQDVSVPPARYGRPDLQGPGCRQQRNYRIKPGRLQVRPHALRIYYTVYVT